MLGISDTVPELVKFLGKNPGTCLVAEENGRVVGAVMGGYDGRRGLVHHLAVDPEMQRRGIGAALMKELEDRYREMGVVKYHLWIEDNSEAIIDFYRNIGCELRDLITMSKTLRR